MANESMKARLPEMKLLFEYLEALEVLEIKVSFDVSLARSLGYYTGAIYEIVTEGSPPLAGVSIAIAAPSRPAKKSAKAG